MAEPILIKSNSTNIILTSLSHSLGNSKRLLQEVFEDQELMYEFNCREVTRNDLEDLKNALEKVSQAFYKSGQPT